MNVFSSDQNANINQSTLNLIGDVSKQINNPDVDGGNVDLYENELLTLWKNTGDVFVSSCRLGNFSRDAFGNVLKTKKGENQQTYPAILFYKNTLEESYPLLDIGVQVRDGEQKPVISFKKLESDQLVEYANIELDGDNLTTNSKTSINKTSNSNNSAQFVENTSFLPTTNNKAVFQRQVFIYDEDLNNGAIIKYVNNYENIALPGIKQLCKKKKTIYENPSNNSITEVGVGERILRPDGMTEISENTCKLTRYRELKPNTNSSSFYDITVGKTDNYCWIKIQLGGTSTVNLKSTKGELAKNNITSGRVNTIYYIDIPRTEFVTSPRIINLINISTGWTKSSPQNLTTTPFSFGNNGGVIQIAVDLYFSTDEAYFTYAQYNNS